MKTKQQLKEELTKAIINGDEKWNGIYIPSTQDETQASNLARNILNKYARDRVKKLRGMIPKIDYYIRCSAEKGASGRIKELEDEKGEIAKEILSLTGEFNFKS
jgi:hypothetical protein